MNSCRNILKNKGFTLVEITVSVAIMSFLGLGIFSGLSLVSKNINKSKYFITARKEIATFVASASSFASKSETAYFYDTGNGTEFNFIDDFTSKSGDDVIFNTVSFVKDTNGNEGDLIYDPSARTISWRRMTGVIPVVMLQNVVRHDYVDESNQGTKPVFRFPHSTTLYPSLGKVRPKLIIIQFKKLINTPTAQYPVPLNIPVRLMFKFKAVQS